MEGQPIIAGSVSKEKKTKDQPIIPGSVSNEKKMLAKDLRELKHCQVQYFTISITGAGMLLGLAAILKGPTLAGLALLTPLVIILPCWFIFFDKATTIARIIGYLRILEDRLWNGAREGYTYKGYENGLADYRENETKFWKEISEEIEKDPKKALPKSDFWKMLLLKTRHRYWMLNWYTFALLSFVCCIASYTALSEDFARLPLFIIQIIATEENLWAGIAFTFVILCAIYTFIMIYSLTCGQHSYEGCFRIWKKVFTMKPNNDTWDD